MCEGVLDWFVRSWHRRESIEPRGEQGDETVRESALFFVVVWIFVGFFGLGFFFQIKV